MLLLHWPQAVPLALVSILLSLLSAVCAVFPQPRLKCSFFGAGDCLVLPSSPAITPRMVVVLAGCVREEGAPGQTARKWQEGALLNLGRKRYWVSPHPQEG